MNGRIVTENIARRVPLTGEIRKVAKRKRKMKEFNAFSIGGISLLP